MPACVDCHKYDPKKRSCSVPDGSPIRKCVIAILEQELRELEPEKKILEIGCGSWDFAKKIIESKGCYWFGIDPLSSNEHGVPTIATHNGTVANIPFGNNFFDYVLGNQTLEHWPEWKTSYTKGFREIYRVLKPGGILSMNFPIHLHGDNIFVKGDLPKILKLFNPTLWEGISIAEYRKEYEPLEPSEGYRMNGYRKDDLIWSQRIPSSWIMRVSAKKRGNMSQTKCLACQILEWFK